MTCRRGDFLLTAKLNWKPLPCLPFVTCTEVNASTTGFGAGSSTAGPIISVRFSALSTAYPRNTLRQSDAQDAPDPLGKILGPHRSIGIADAPILLRVAEKPRGDVVEALALGDGVELQRREAVGRRQDAPSHVRNGAAIGRGQRDDGQTVVPAGGGKCRGGWRGGTGQRLDPRGLGL